MANPNIVQASSVLGKTGVLAVTASPLAIISGVSNKIVKVNTLNIANVTSSTAGQITVDIFRSSVAYPVAYVVNVPPNSALVVISKENMFYLEEADTLRLTANAISVLVGTCSYEEIQ